MIADAVGFGGCVEEVEGVLEGGEVVFDGNEGVLDDVNVVFELVF